VRGTYTITSFNAENFSMLLDADYGAAEFRALSDERYAAMNPSIFNPNKDRAKAAAIASTILERDFDVVGLCEIGGMETLENFNRYYLDGRYEPYLHEANSRRGIFVGALVKKGRSSTLRENGPSIGLASTRSKRPFLTRAPTKMPRRLLASCR